MSASQSLDIAVVGSGISGILSAYLLSKKHRVTIFEGNDYLGGHTYTITIPSGQDQGTAVDCGFIVLNNKTYPVLHKFFSELQVPVRWSDMSFSFYCPKSGCLYAGTDLDQGLGLNGLFADRANIFRPSFWKFIFGIRKFCTDSLEALTGDISADLTLRELARKLNTPARVLDDYVVPMGGAIWSASVEEILDFPALTFLNFFRNHGLLTIKDRPRWQTVVGGSRSYVDAFIKSFNGQIKLNSKVFSVRRSDNAVALSVGTQEHKFDRVVIATHADQALTLLADPTAQERAALSAWSYSNNRVVLHTDISFLPPKRAAWASWNYRNELSEQGTEPVSVTYHMNRLQGLKTSKEYCVTLNPRREFASQSVISDIVMTHPQYTRQSIAARAELDKLNGTGLTYYAGAYFGYGFHEDGAKSALAVAKQFGIDL